MLYLYYNVQFEKKNYKLTVETEGLSDDDEKKQTPDDSADQTAALGEQL